MPKYFRHNIFALAGYVPGEQPGDDGVIKLNTNENPYGPSPRVRRADGEELPTMTGLGTFAETSDVAGGR